ncbi:DUF2306 domain-containing protein, partial [Salmonella enterica]|uniref:DUF2306 domain-containing protein n=1 Tax=Salmonella enterica TaxID=28901 RepID=UPI003CE691E2
MSVALAAVVIGPFAFWARLGRTVRPRWHRALGYAWFSCMAVTVLSALFIRSHDLPNIAGYTPLHLLVPATAFLLYRGL